MNRSNHYYTLHNEFIDVSAFDAEETKLLRELEAKQAKAASYQDYANGWRESIAALYNARGRNRKEAAKTDLWRIAKDLGSRLLIRLKVAVPPSDYRDDLDHLIRERFDTRRSFCEATGISEDMLSHVLARRKHLAVDTLGDALKRIGYRLQIAPIDTAG